MALFSPSLMADSFLSSEVMVKTHYSGDAVSPLRMFQTKGTPHAWINKMQALRKDDSPAGKILRESFAGGHGYSSGSWTGFGRQSIGEALDAGVITAAHEAFQRAEGGLETHYTRATPELRAVGSAFSVGRVMQGHPKAALYRPKIKLPPKTINISLSVSAGVRAETIADQMSKIAKAIWQYSMAGGIVEFTVSFLCKFHRPQEWNGVKHYGLIDSLRINPSNAAQYATAASGQFFRGWHLPLAQALSGQDNDSLQCLDWGHPGVFQFTGYMRDCEKVLAALRVK